MRALWKRLLGLVSVRWEPDPAAREFLERLVRQSAGGLNVGVAVLGNRESARHFGLRMSRRGMQPVWIEVENASSRPVRLAPADIDPSYFTPLEAAYANHFSMGKRLLSYGLLAWMFLPLVPLLPFKLWGARSVNRRMNAFFKACGFRGGAIFPGERRSGFVFVGLDEGTKNVAVSLISTAGVQRFEFVCDVPGFDPQTPDEDVQQQRPLVELEPSQRLAWLGGLERATTNGSGAREGDPLNLVVVGSRSMVLAAFGARWDLAESITLASCWKTTRSYLFATEYRYSPVSPLYHQGRVEDLALQMARTSINQRIHLRLWRTDRSFDGQQVWIGQVSRDIGVRFTMRSWSLTTHKIDEDVDEARDYVIDYLMTMARVAHVGYVGGVGAAAPDAPRQNLTGDPYFTDGRRAVLVLSPVRVEASLLPWSRPAAPAAAS